MNNNCKWRSAKNNYSAGPLNMNSHCCIACFDNVIFEEGISIECSQYLGLEKMTYRYIHKDCFEQSGLSISFLKSQREGNMYCPWCNINWGTQYDHPWGCIQFIVFSRPCGKCWDKHGISL